jgi:uncharacterized protein
MKFLNTVLLAATLLSCEAEPKATKAAVISHKFTNKLINESSPYLLQHAHNPVNWFPWGEEAFALAKKEDKPILLSIGYAACHWCHVMEHESFANEETAKILNDNFVCIKVDREERPDVDKIYMNYLMLTQGSGGWPLNVFLTPEREPFFGGTYFPPKAKFGRPGFKEIAVKLSAAWKNQRENILSHAGSAREALGRTLDMTIPKAPVDNTDITQAISSLVESFDKVEGGFGPAPKFPPTQSLHLLMVQDFRSTESYFMDMAQMTLFKMAMGGMYDQIGGGFHRYSTDKEWLVPHFEKMLYDNALLAPAYLNAWKITGEKYYRKIALETLDYIIRDMQAKEGGYFSSQDADSDGTEGKYYTWEKKQISQVLVEDAEVFNKLYGLTADGNYDSEDGRRVTILTKKSMTLPVSLEKDEAWKKALMAVRYKRIPPLTDDKILASWNGMMIKAMAQAHRATGNEKYLKSALQAAEFIFAKMILKDGSLLRSSRLGKPSNISAFLDDYTHLTEACTELYESTYETKWLTRAQSLITKIDELFIDSKKGGYFYTSSTGEALIARSRSFEDGAIPNANASLCRALIRLASITGDQAYRKKAEVLLEAASGGIRKYPRSHLKFLRSLDALANGTREIVIAAPTQEAAAKWLQVAAKSYHPMQVVLYAAKDSQGYLKDKTMDGDKVTAYICYNQMCKAPISDFAEFEKALKKSQ